MISEDRLIGWLCLLRHNWSDDLRMNIPDVVANELVARGWLDVDDDKNWNGGFDASITRIGLAVADLNDPEWGIEYVLEEAD